MKGAVFLRQLMLRGLKHKLRIFPAILIAWGVVFAVNVNEADADGDGSPDLTFPLRGIFYYPWYPQTWSVDGVDVWYDVQLGYYSSDNQAVVDQHVQDLEYAKVDVAIASWWGVDRQNEASRIPLLMERTLAAGSDLKWAIYYESEGSGNPSLAELQSDLAYLKSRYTSHQAFARIDGKPVIFVYNSGDTSCEVTERWAQAANGEWYVVLKVFGGYGSCADQPDAWHQYGPAVPVSHFAGNSYNISPGFWRADETAPRLARDPSRWTQNVRDMVASQEPWQLITSYNEWGEGTASERCHDWASSSGYGVYLDALHSDGIDTGGDNGTGGATVDASTLDNKIMAGYQGWFNADGDGAGKGWRHWGDGSANTPNADNITFDMWPDLREYDADELYNTDFKYSNGSAAGLYSAYTPKTVERHLKWMQDYGIDGVFVQRFIGEATGSFRGMRDRVLQNVRAGAEKYGRVFANMYDISGGDSGSLVDDIKNDWMHLVDDLGITASSRYLHHNGRPVLSIWGFNTNGRPGTASQALELIRWLTTDAAAKYRVTVKLGVDDDWRTDSADWQQAYRSADIISPWAVGRYGDNSGADNFRNNKIEPDLADLNAANIDYMPVVFPGFSWWNLKGEKFNHIQRNGGRFFWHQFYNAIDAGCNMVYVAMFDEVDEGTAIYKVAGNDSQTPTTGRFVTLDEDGEDLPSDWYLRLTGEAAKMLRNQIGLTSTIPIDPDETGGESNHADTDDDNDGMPDDWELTYGLNPLVDDAAGDPDGDDISNINEFNSGTAPNHFEGNLKPDTPALLAPEEGATVSLTPRFETGDFSDPNVNDDHSRTQWMVVRAADGVCVFDVTSDSSLTSLTLPRQILEEETGYIWKARFIDTHNLPSEWSAEREFASGPADHDSDKNGVPDAQEVSATLDLDADGTVDLNQTDIKCVSMPDGDGQVQTCISIRDAQNVEAIVSLQVQDPADPGLNSATNGKPNYFEFGLLDFKLLVTNPGDETTVTIYLSRPAYKEGNCFKYDPVNEIWLDYSGYTEFSDNRREIYLTLRDGGFGDADGIENGIIVDPLAFGSETDPGGVGSGSSTAEDLIDGILPNDLSCFITTAADGLNERGPGGLRQEIRGCGLWLLYLIVMLGFVAKALSNFIPPSGDPNDLSISRHDQRLVLPVR